MDALNYILRLETIKDGVDFLFRVKMLDVKTTPTPAMKDLLFDLILYCIVDELDLTPTVDMEVFQNTKLSDNFKTNQD